MHTRYLDLIDRPTREKVTAPLPSAWTLPPCAYTDSALFDAEVEQLFLRDWICVGRSEQVAEPGDYISVNLPGVPLVVCRDLQGTLHALSSVCLHRAMPIVEGQGSATRFVCPYHKWTYELDGRLRSAPMMQDVKAFQVESCRLPTLQIEVWHGFIFVNADADAPSLHPQLSGLEDRVANYRFENLRITDTLHYPSPWNWKILVENFMEAYHHIGTHQKSLELAYPGRQSTVPDNGGAPWAFLDMPGELPADAAISSFPDLSPAQRQGLFAAVIFPTFLFAASNEAGVWYELQPTAHDQMELYIHILLHPDFAAALSDEQRAEVRDQIAAVHEEDIGANAGPWQGLNSPFARQGRLSGFEKAVWQMNQHWIQRMEASR